MRNGLIAIAWAAVAVLLAASAGQLHAAKPLGMLGWLKGKGVDLRSYACDKCGGLPEGEVCIERVPVEACVTGKKEVHECKIHYECVSIPETRYRWKKRLVTREIPCKGCKPVCKTEEGYDCFGEEKWETYPSGKCGELHCKRIEPKQEKVPCKHCEYEFGETTIKVKYWTCVKEPYTVYRQVQRPVCVKHTHYEKVEVPITKYVCEHCHGAGCFQCGDAVQK